MQNSNKNKLLNVSELNEKKNRVNVAAGSRSKKSRSKNGSFIVNMNMNGN
jgi:hypothetical protein